MPQLDPYTFLHQIITLVIFFFLLYAYIRKQLIPSINAILKYRIKRVDQLARYDKGHWNLYNRTWLYFNKRGLEYMNTVLDLLYLSIPNYNSLVLAKSKKAYLDFEFKKDQLSKLSEYQFKNFIFKENFRSLFYLKNKY